MYCNTVEESDAINNILNISKTMTDFHKWMTITHTTKKQCITIGPAINTVFVNILTIRLC